MILSESTREKVNRENTQEDILRRSQQAGEWLDEFTTVEYDLEVMSRLPKCLVKIDDRIILRKKK